MKRTYLVAIVGIGLVLGAFFYGRMGSETAYDPLLDLKVASDDHVQGDPSTATVVVVEYSDTECPYCKTFHQKFEAQMFRQYADRVAWVYRHYPLPIYTRSGKEAEALECATAPKGPDMFWRYLEQIYAATPSRDGLDPAILPVIAKNLGLSVEDFTNCLSTGTYTKKVRDQKLAGSILGVRQTPSVIIWNTSTNERILISGANSRFLEVKSLVEEFLGL
jgi:protein-disulfide isomerase